MLVGEIRRFNDPETSPYTPSTLVPRYAQAKASEQGLSCTIAAARVPAGHKSAQMQKLIDPGKILQAQMMLTTAK